jgi:hypothetical protein
MTTDSPRKSEVLRLRLSAREYDVVRRAAAESGVPMRDLLRRAVQRLATMTPRTRRRP